MRKGGGGEKGAQFERNVCDAFSRWVDPSTKITHFWRTAASGGRATVRFQSGKMDNQAGDLVSITDKGHPFTNNFTVECKHVKTLNIASGIIKDCQELSLFWRQAVRDASRAGKRPILVARQNTFPIIVLLRTADYVKYFDYSPNVFSYEVARLFKLGARPGTQVSVSMLLLDDLLRLPYDVQRFA